MGVLRLKVLILSNHTVKWHMLTQSQSTFSSQLSIFDQVRPAVSNIEVVLPNKPTTTKNIDEGLKGPQRKFWKEALLIQYEKKKC